MFSLIVLVQTHLKHPPILGGGTALQLFKGAVEGGYAGKAGLQRDLGNGKVRLHQHCLRGFDPPVEKVLIEIAAGKLLEGPGKMEFGKARHGGHVFQGQVLGEMPVQVSKHRLKPLGVVALAGMGQLGKGDAALGGQAASSEIQEQGQQP